MKTVSITILVLITSVSIAFAGWMTDIVTNQNLALDYISELRYNPKATRPRFKPAKGGKSKRAMIEIMAAIKRAEKLVKAGKAHLIERPIFTPIALL